MVFNIIALTLLAFGLFRDYQRDKGQHVSPKIVHAIFLALLIISYAGSFRILGMLIRDFEGVKQRFSHDVGFVPGDVHWVIYLLHSAVVMVVIILAYQMIRRSNKSRQLLLKVLPLAGLLEVFGFYRGWVADGDDMGLNHGVIIFVAMLLVGSITTMMYLGYKSESMRNFFALDVPKLSGTPTEAAQPSEVKSVE